MIGGIYNPQCEERAIKVCLIEFGEKFLPRKKGEHRWSQPPGWYGTLANFGLGEGADLTIPVSATTCTQPVMVVGIYYTMTYKLDAFQRHERQTDFADLIFLVRHYHKFIYPFRKRFKWWHANNFVDKFVQKYPTWYQRIYDVIYTLGLSLDTKTYARLGKETDEGWDSRLEGHKIV